MERTGSAHATATDRDDDAGREDAAARAAGQPRPPRRPRRRHEPARQGAHADRAARDRPAGRPAAAGQRGDLGHQRQDDDAPRWRPRSSSAPGLRLVHNRAGANMAGGVASTLAAAAGRRRADRRRARAVRGRRVLAGPRRAGARTAVAAARQPVPRPARPLRGAGDDRRPLGGDGRRTGPRRSARAQRRRSADRRPRPRPRRRSSISAWRTARWRSARCSTPSDSKHCRRCGAAYVYDAIYLGHLGHLPLPGLRRDRPEPDGRARRTSSCAAPDAASLQLRTPAGQRRRRAARSRASTTSTTRWAPRRCACALGIAPRRRSPTGSAAVSAAFGRAERIAIGERELSLLLIKNPAGANEVLRTLALEDGRARPARPCSTTAPPTAATSPGCGMPTSSCSPAGAPGHLRRYPRGRAGAALEVRGGRPRAAARRPGTARGARRARSPARAAAALFALPTYTALLELRAELARRGHVEEFWARQPRMSPAAHVIWHDLECGSYHEDLALWRALAAATAARCSTSARAPAACRSISRAPATR